MTAIPKPPKRRREAIKVHPDGREVCNMSHPVGRREYFIRLSEMVERQGYVCVCGSDDSAYFGHEISRGNGGSTRDDRILHEDGVTWRNAALCYNCNSEQGSRHFHWVDNNTRYVPVVREHVKGER